MRCRAGSDTGGTSEKGETTGKWINMFDLVNQYQTSVREFMATCDAFSFFIFLLCSFALRFSGFFVAFVYGCGCVWTRKRFALANGSISVGGRGRTRQEGTNMQSDSSDEDVRISEREENKLGTARFPVQECRKPI